MELLRLGRFSALHSAVESAYASPSGAALGEFLLATQPFLCFASLVRGLACEEEMFFLDVLQLHCRFDGWIKVISEDRNHRVVLNV